MYRFRCLAHATVTAVAIVSWGGVLWGIYHAPDPDAMMRLPWFALLSVAAVSSGLAVLPAVAFGFDGGGRRTERDERALCEAFYWWGREDEAAGVQGAEVPEERAALLRLVR